MEVLVQPAIERWFTPEFVAAQGEIVRRYAAWIRENDALGYAAACRSLATLGSPVPARRDPLPHARRGRRPR